MKSIIFKKTLIADALIVLGILIHMVRSGHVPASLIDLLNFAVVELLLVFNLLILVGKLENWRKVAYVANIISSIYVIGLLVLTLIVAKGHPDVFILALFTLTSILYIANLRAVAKTYRYDALASLPGYAFTAGWLVLGFIQLAATFAALDHWLHWPGWAAFLVGTFVVFGLRISIVNTALGIAGAHYGWGWGWPAGVILFFGPVVLFLAFAGINYLKRPNWPS